MIPPSLRRNATGGITSAVRPSGQGPLSLYAMRPSSVVKVWRHDPRTCDRDLPVRRVRRSDDGNTAGLMMTRMLLAW